MKIWNATIHTMTDAGILENGYVCIENGKITEVGTGTPSVLAPEDIDAGGSVLLPGFIDAHTHLGIIENGIAFEGDDCNEATDPFTPHLRVIDGVNPLDHCFAEARAAGVTTVMTSPGSANACGGTMAILKTAGRMADRMQIGTGVKFALGENPKSVYNDRDETPITRMATAAMIREGLAKAQRYQQELDFAESDPDEHMPDYDAKSEALLPLLERDVKAHFHCHRADDICTAHPHCQRVQPGLCHYPRHRGTSDCRHPGGGKCQGHCRSDPVRPLQAGDAEPHHLRAVCDAESRGQAGALHRPPGHPHPVPAHHSGLWQ